MPAAAVSVPGRLLRLGANPHVLGGLAVYGVSTVFWLIALRDIKLSVAYPMVSLSYVVVVLGSQWLFGESINLFQKAGLVLIVGGVLLLMKQ